MRFLLVLVVACISNIAIASSWEFRTASNLEDLINQAWHQYPESGNPIAREYEGYIEYKSTIHFEDEIHNSGIYLGLIGDADKTYINGVQVGQTGDFPPYYSYNMDTERTYFLPEGLIKKGSNEIRIIVYSKFLVNKGFNPNEFKIAPNSELDKTKYADELKNNLSKIVVPILCLVLTVVSFPLLAPKHLWNSQLMIFLIGLSSFVLGICRGRIGYHYFDMLIVYKATLFSSVLTILLVTIFMTKSCKSWFRFIPTSIASLLISAVLVSHTLLEAAGWARIWFHVSPIFLVVALYGNLRTSGLKSLTSFGLMVLIATNFNDNLNDLRIISTVSLLQFGLGIFISTMIIDQLLVLKRSWEKYFMKEARLEVDAATGRQAIQIAHDLRIPLESIKVGLENIRNKTPLDNSLIIGLKRMNEICEQLLRNDHKLDLKNIGLNEISREIKEVVTELNSIIGENQIILLEKEIDSAYSIKIDIKMLKRTLSNLLNNSIEASQKSKQIKLILKSHNNMMDIEILDEGSGFNGNLERVFDRGFTTKKNGNGIGLSSAKEFVDIIGGHISINPLEIGTRIKISIPIFKNLKPRSIVLIDDDPIVRFNWKRQGLQNDVKVDCYDSFESFFKVRKKYPLDLPIYIDSDLGALKGEIVAKELKQEGFLTIFLTTGYPKNFIAEGKEWITDIVGKCFESAVIRSGYPEDVLLE